VVEAEEEVLIELEFQQELVELDQMEEEKKVESEAWLLGELLVHLHQHSQIHHHYLHA
jgi:hypothetical protein